MQLPTNRTTVYMILAALLLLWLARRKKAAAQAEAAPPAPLAVAPVPVFTDSTIARRAEAPPPVQHLPPPRCDLTPPQQWAGEDDRSFQERYTEWKRYAEDCTTGINKWGYANLVSPPRALLYPSALDSFQPLGSSDAAIFATTHAQAPATGAGHAGPRTFQAYQGMTSVYGTDGALVSRVPTTTPQVPGGYR